jgi:hypothetical protein
MPSFLNHFLFATCLNRQLVHLCAFRKAITERLLKTRNYQKEENNLAKMRNSTFFLPSKMSTPSKMRNSTRVRLMNEIVFYCILHSVNLFEKENFSYQLII